jgi:hypothetical protein
MNISKAFNTYLNSSLLYRIAFLVILIAFSS